jgi:hypothetical protein
LRDMWSSVATFAPKFAAFLVILIVGWIVAKLIGKVVDKILERVGFDRAVERGGVKKALQRSQYDASTIASKIVYYALLLFVLQLAFGVFGPNAISDLIAGVIAFLPKLFVALIIVVVASAIAAVVRDLLSNMLGGLSYGRMLATIASIFILGLGVIAALNQVGVAVTVTMPVLIAVLATIGGILVVGVGGGLIRPMQERWDRYLTRAEQESQNIRQQVSTTGAGDQARHSAAAYPGASAYPQAGSQQPPYFDGGTQGPPQTPPPGTGYPQQPAPAEGGYPPGTGYPPQPPQGGYPGRGF